MGAVKVRKVHLMGFSGDDPKLFRRGLVLFREIGKGGSILLLPEASSLWDSVCRTVWLCCFWKVKVWSGRARTGRPEGQCRGACRAWAYPTLHPRWPAG